MVLNCLHPPVGHILSVIIPVFIKGSPDWQTTISLDNQSNPFNDISLTKCYFDMNIPFGHVPFYICQSYFTFFGLA